MKQLSKEEEQAFDELYKAGVLSGQIKETLSTALRLAKISKRMYDKAEKLQAKLKELGKSIEESK
jgi:hypothetical protein